MAAKNTFVPFIPSVGLNSQKPATSSQFQPLTAQTLANSAVAASSPSTPLPHGESKITLQKEGDVVTHIRIECACGLVTEVQCVY